MTEGADTFRRKPGEARAELVRRMVDRIIDGTDLYVIDVEVHPFSGRHTVNVFLEGEKGITIDQCAAVSRQLGRELEEGDHFGGPYSLNVSSPDAKKPLRVPRQFRNHIGRTLTVRKVHAEDETHRPQLEGRLVAIEDDGIVMESQGGSMSVPFADIAEARVKLPW